MFKKIAYYYILSSILFLTSCQDFLQEEAYDMKTNTNFFLTPEDAEMAMIGTYSYLADAYRQSTIEMLTQNSGAFNKGKKTNMWVAGSFDATTKEVYETWDFFFALIDRSNDLIANVSQMDVLEDEDKAAILGEARFLRAWSNFVLVRMYGRIPLRLEPTRGIDAGAVPLSSSEEVYSKVILPDLKYAKQNCAAEYDASHAGRITSGAAAAALSKVYLTLAGNVDGSAYWDSARVEAKWVMDTGLYQLTDDFNDLWTSKNTSESVFEVQYIRGIYGSGYSKIFTPAKSGWSAKNGGWSRSTATQKTYDDFRMTYEPAFPGNADGKENGSNDYGIPADYRVQCTYVDQYVRTDNGRTTFIYPTQGYKASNDSWPQIAKWKDPEAPDNFQGDNNFIVIRYADVLLMYAEAENEVNGPTDLAYDAIDAILERARKADGTARTAPANWDRTAGLTKEEFREKVFNERRFELCAEQHLWFDLVRKGVDTFMAFKTADNEHGRKTAKHGVYERGILFPIPATEMAANSKIDVTDQNPGY
ncbi:RagB/SusD family nutrient uptake outer membrane protein [Labilibacter sediminis]|nr:RagB/SusD family nutrient uptake outer membrane protein [Labilibacter sediminis]